MGKKAGGHGGPESEGEREKRRGHRGADETVRPDMRMILLGEAEVFACGYFLTHLPNQFLLNRPRLRRASPLPSSAAA